MTDPVELPDFSIPHAEKIEWMIETAGWALESVAADAPTDPPSPTCSYTIGVPELTGFPEIAVFGLTPAASKGLLGLVVDNVSAGTEIPLGVELVGLLDNELRCVFAPIEAGHHERWFATALAWYGGRAVEFVQLIYPDRNGFLPYEAGFDQRLRYAQPVIGRLG